ncbi:immunoglobulin domain-containing protein [Jonesia quinghaiensis]|uniref:immunoglobulin domain-containing protein n=1 Tax=Jonesia quinghaiensis TaxID=262806 RepID=UPI00042A27F0|nr:immunoglobulin domain-containing protein [Jonesia quinghaiensis]
MEQIRRRVVSTGLALALAATTFAAAPATATPTTTAQTSVILVTAKAGAPKVSAQPKALTQANGKAAKFTVKATGKSLKYQWYIKKPGSSKWVKATGASAKKATYSVKSTTKLNGSQVRVIVTNTKGKVTSKAAKLTVVTTPKISAQPKNVNVEAGSKVSFTTKATGGSLKYQWQVNDGSGWKNVSGATKATYSFTARSKHELNGYRVVVTNKAGKKTSKPAGLFVDSTETDPMLANQWFSLANWEAGFSSTSHASGTATAKVTVFNANSTSVKPGRDIEVIYVGKSGNEYAVTSTIPTSAAIGSGKEKTFTLKSTISATEAKGGFWVIFDYSSGGDYYQIVKGY